MQVMKKGLVLAVGVALALPFAAAFAQSADDVAYCRSLASTGRTINRGADPTGAIGNALGQCDSNPGAAIPVLEKFLTDSKVSLPPRPSMAAPPPPFNPRAYRTTAECLTAAYAAKATLSLCTK